MITGDKDLDAINEEVAQALKTWQADPNQDNAQALANAENKKTDYLAQLRQKQQQDYLKRFMSSR